MLPVMPLALSIPAGPAASLRAIRWRAWVALVALGALLAVIWFLAPFSPRQAHLRRLEIRAALASDDARVRKQAAWRAIEEPDPFSEVALTQMVLGGEEDAAVREACVYALGRIGKPENFAAVEFAIDLDDSGVVRASAWVAAARLDPDHCRRLLESAKSGDEWDRLGVAHARLLLGDVSDVATLLTLAESSDWGLSCGAGAALQRGLRPLLEAIGRWPLKSDPPLNAPWPAGLIATVRERSNEIDLAALAADTLPRIAEARRAKRGIEKVKTARERISAWLFSQSRPSIDE